MKIKPLPHLPKWMTTQADFAGRVAQSTWSRWGVFQFPPKPHPCPTHVPPNSHPCHIQCSMPTSARQNPSSRSNLRAIRRNTAWGTRLKHQGVHNPFNLDRIP